MTSIKINKLEIENVKRVKAVKIEPSINGLTIVGGNNNQGKTSVLDAIAWALGGNKYRPTQASREGSAVPPHLHIVMSNGLIVERKGKNSDLKVIDPEGNKGGQQQLNSFVEELAIDLPKFMESTGNEKAQTLLQIIGVGEQLAKIEYEENQLYNQRHAIGQIADQKDKFAKEQPYYPDAPKELVSVSELIQQQQEILARNGENQQKRLQLTQIEDRFRQEEVNIDLLIRQINDMKIKLEEAKTAHEKTRSDLIIAEQTAVSLQDESTAELEKTLRTLMKSTAKLGLISTKTKPKKKLPHIARSIKR